MTLAYLCTFITYLGAELAQSLEPSGVTADPASGENTKITTISAQPGTARHKIVVMLFHTDHVVRACLADLSTGETGIDTGFLLLRKWC
ncbi:MAG: hypothetical protein AB7L09_04810 [Nitrospira sp.]